MPNSPMYYREESPSIETSHFVLSYWEFTINAETPQPIMHEVFPEGCVTIIFYRNKLLSIQRLFVSAINPKSIYIPMRKGDTMYGMRILPEAGAAFFGSNPAEITTGEIEKENFGFRFSAELQNQLNTCEDFSEAVAVFEDYSKSFGVQREEIDPRLSKATRIFIETEGLAKISETARKIGLSERQFERNYQKASGLTPKQFARICRFRATAVDLVKNSKQNWANRAAAKGFTDQSHLNREFSNLSGNSPIEFSENVKRISHGKIIE
jgi:AraC-like DNA-binding protein